LIRRAPLKYDFVRENAGEILMKLHKLETENGFCSDQNRNQSSIVPLANHDNITHLSRHEVSELSRAKMVDWMFEVIAAFKMSHQTFSLAVQFMDRYLEQTMKLVP
jgi:hypothetical protein